VRGLSDGVSEMTKTEPTQDDVVVWELMEVHVMTKELRSGEPPMEPHAVTAHRKIFKSGKASCESKVGDTPVFAQWAVHNVI
jgi:hypothetical protein